jgi:RNase H-fold protein (predicted Holliday junction resolvase)
MEKSIHRQNKAEISHVMAIDFGESKVGLAMADMETKIAFVYGIIQNDKELLNKLEKIVVKEGVEKIIMGIPTYKLSSNCHPESHGCHPELVSGSKKNDIRSRNKFGMTDCSEYEKLGNEIVKKMGIEVEYQDEMFTTKMAQENIKERGDKNIAQKDDAEAAKIILQDWLDRS